MASVAETSSIDIVNKIVANRKNSNLILNLQELLLSENEDVPSVIDAVRQLFLHFLNTEEMICDFSKDESESDAHEKYRLWLLERYDDIKKHLLDYTKHTESVIQEHAIDALMDFIQAEAKHPFRKVPEGIWFFPKDTFKDVIVCLVTNERDMSSLISYFNVYMKDDIKLYTLKSLNEILDSHRSECKGKQHLLNAFNLLTKIHYPNTLAKTNEHDISTDVFIRKEDGQEFVLKKKSFNKVFSQVWLQFLKCKIPMVLYKRLLVYLPKRILPHLNDPLLLTDFLTDSYLHGGIVSVLALNGLFYLIQNYNLEYPDFFKKLYMLFNIEVVTSKYRPRFFYLANLFLSSTHLPGYLVASFAKRLARLALLVPPDVILIILPFVANLLIRHPSLEVLINFPGQSGIGQDPYIFEEHDPMKSNAINSSLWEIKSLQKHWHPDVSRKAQFINSKLREIEWDVSNLFEMTFDDMINKEIAVQPVEIPMSYDKPSGFFQREEDCMNDLWTL